MDSSIAALPSWSPPWNAHQPSSPDGVVIANLGHSDLVEEAPFIRNLSQLPLFIVGLLTEDDALDEEAQQLCSRAAMVIDLTPPSEGLGIPGRATVRTGDEEFVVQLAQF